MAQKIPDLKIEGDDSLHLSEQETQILALYDRLESLQLEISFLQTQGIISKRENPRSHWHITWLPC